MFVTSLINAFCCITKNKYIVRSHNTLYQIHKKILLFHHRNHNAFLHSGRNCGCFAKFEHFKTRDSKQTRAFISVYIQAHVYVFERYITGGHVLKALLSKFSTMLCYVKKS